MKKLKYLVVLLVTCLFTTINVNAANFSTYLKGTSTIYAGGTVNITVGVSGASNLWGFKAPLTYDSSKLTLTNYSGLNGFSLAVGSNLVADTSSGQNGSINVATLTFKATSAFKVGESVAISLGTAEGSDGENLQSGSGSSLVVKMAAPLASNNNLSSLSISPKNITFNKNTTSYSITVEHDVTSIDISAKAEDTKAKVIGTGNKDLNLYTNTFEVVVTAENGTKKTYTITVIRKDKDGNIKELSTNNKLANLEIANYPIAFNEEISEYTILTKELIKDTDIIATAADEFATVSVDFPKEFKKGNNKITITVIAENGDKKEYIINAVSVDEVEVEEESNIIPTLFIIESIIFGILLLTFVILVLKKKIVFKFNKKK